MKHAFVRRLTNEGVLTFRCFLSKSWLKGWNIWGEKTIMRIHFSTDLQTNYVQHVGPGCKRLRVAARFFTRRKQKKKKKRLFHFELRGNRSRCELFMKAVQRQAGKPQRNTWDESEMFVLSLLWFMSSNHLNSVSAALIPLLILTTDRSKDDWR